MTKSLCLLFSIFPICYLAILINVSPESPVLALGDLLDGFLYKWAYYFTSKDSSAPTIWIQCASMSVLNNHLVPVPISLVTEKFGSKEYVLFTAC